MERLGDGVAVTADGDRDRDEVAAPRDGVGV